MISTAIEFSPIIYKILAGLVLAIITFMPKESNGQFRITTDLRSRVAASGIHVITDGNAFFLDGHSGSYVYSDTLTVDNGYNWLRVTALPMGGWIKLKTNINSSTGLQDSLNARLRITAFTGAAIITALGYTPANSASTDSATYQTKYRTDTARTNIYTSLAGKQAIVSSGTGISIASNTVTNTAPDQTVSLTGANNFTSTGTYPNFTLTQYIPTVTNAVTRPINSTTFTVSTTKQAYVTYNVTISCTATIGSAATGSIALQYSTNGGGVWNTVGTVSNSNTVTLAIVLNSVQASGLQVSGYIPANALVRMVPATAGTSVITYLTGQETY